MYNIKPSTKKHPNLAQQNSLLYPIKYRINMFVLVWIHINIMYITTIFWLTGGWCYQPKIHPTKHGSKTLKSHRCGSVHRKVITLFSASFPQGRGSTPTHGDSFKVLKGPELLVFFVCLLHHSNTQLCKPFPFGSVEKKVLHMLFEVLRAFKSSLCLLKLPCLDLWFFTFLKWTCPRQRFETLTSLRWFLVDSGKDDPFKNWKGFKCNKNHLWLWKRTVSRYL